MISDSQETGVYKLATGATGFDRTISVVNNVMELGSVSTGQSVKINGKEYTLSMNDDELTLRVNAPVAQYVYLDFDGEELVRYNNPDLELSIDLPVVAAAFSEEQRAAIVSELTKQYTKYNIVFTMERPAEDVTYSTLFFGQSSAFAEYGDFFGVAETYDGNNQIKNDNAFILLDESYSQGQIVSVASHMLDHLLGLSYFVVDGAPSLMKYAENQTLLSYSADWIQDDPYNKYCPIDPKTGERCITGCANNAASQIIYYWLEKGMLDLTLTLEDSDAYKCTTGVTIDSSDAPTSGHLSFVETNRLLSAFETENIDCVAALCFAAGVIQRAQYSSGETGAFWNKSLFVRAGFDPASVVDKYMTIFNWPECSDSYVDSGARLADDDFMVNEILQGRPVGISIQSIAHALVVDGYDSSRNMFHLNFGWGEDKNRWCTLEELIELQVDEAVCGIAPVVSPDLAVKKLSAGADVVSLDEDVTLSFTVSNEGTGVSKETLAYVYCGDTLLGNCGLDYISPGYSRDFTCTFNTAPLKEGKNVLTVKVGSQNDEGSISSAALELQVKAETGPAIPKYEFLINGELLSVRKDFSGGDTFNTITLTTEQLNSFEWLNAEEGVSITVNGLTLEYGKCEFALAKIGESEKIHVQVTHDGAAREFVINTLNTNLPPVTVEGVSQAPGDFFLSFFNTRSIIKTDRNGNIVYYRNEDSPETKYGLWDFKAHQIDGKTYYSYHSAYSNPDSFVTTGHNPGERVIMDEHYNEVARITAVSTEKNGGETALDGHEFLMLGENHYIVLSYIQIVADNIPDVNLYTGEPIEHADKAVLVAAYIQEIDHGEVKFEWLSTDHPELYSMTVTEQVANANDFTNTDPDTYIDYVHLNAIVVDDDGNLVVSCRHLDSMIKIDRNGGTGNLLWALSGLGDDFGLTDEQKTSGQHYLRYMGNGFFSVFNNNNKEGVTKLFLYHLNEDETALSGEDGFRAWVVPGTTEFEPGLPCPPHKTYACGAFQKIGEYGVAGWGWNLSGDELVTEFKLDDASQITFQLRSVYDPSAEYASYRIVKCLSSAPDLTFTAEKASWSEVEASSGYVLSVSQKDAQNALQIGFSGNACDIFNLPNGEYRAMVAGNDLGVSSAESTLKIEDNLSPVAVASTANGIGDLFFAKASGMWENIYYAHHVGSKNDWNGTNERVSASGKNRLADLFFGSDDANILLMTDDENGDALFVDDIYSALPGSVPEQQSRIARIDEIRAGFGDDIVDMTSQRFEYDGEGLTIRGGAGNDTIWANKGNNMLFGDAGNDRIVGASGDDVIAGGIGNDRMHGGGGNDIFTFCENWGVDTVEQLEGSSVTLWFASGSEANWDAETLNYTDGDSSVKVSGVAVGKITLKFGDDGSKQFATLSKIGALFDATSEHIFEESGKGILASL